MQTFEAAPQSSLTFWRRPSAEHSTTRFPVSAQVTASGVQILLWQDACAASEATQIWPGAHDWSATDPPSLSHVDSVVPSLHREEPALQIERTHSPALQRYSGAQSVLRMQETHVPAVASHSSPKGVHCRSDRHVRRQDSLAHLESVEQSELLVQSTHRFCVRSQTLPAGQSREFWHGL